MNIDALHAVNKRDFITPKTHFLDIINHRLYLVLTTLYMRWQDVKFYIFLAEETDRLRTSRISPEKGSLVVLQ